MQRKRLSTVTVELTEDLYMVFNEADEAIGTLVRMGESDDHGNNKWQWRYGPMVFDRITLLQGINLLTKPGRGIVAMIENYTDNPTVTMLHNFHLRASMRVERRRPLRRIPRR